MVQRISYMGCKVKRSACTRSADVGGGIAVEDDASPPDTLASLLLLVRESLDGQEPLLDVAEKTEILRHADSWIG